MYSYYFDRPDMEYNVPSGAGEDRIPVLRPVPDSGEGEKRRVVRRAPEAPRPRRNRRRARAVVVLCLFLALMLGSGAAAVLLNLRGGRPLPALEDLMPWEDGAEDWDGRFAPVPETQESETLVKRAPVGGGTVLSLSPEPEGEALSPRDIYDKSVPSIVSIRGEGDWGASLGTGIILSEDGYIITNHHVIAGTRTVTVTRLDGGGSYDALLVGSDEQTDLAVLKVEAAGLPAAEFGDSASLRVGDPAYAIGNPLGEQLMGTMTDGIISYLDRAMSVDGYEMQLIQTSAALNSGNSGGALVNQYGQVIGVTTLKMSSNWNTIEGLGFAIPTASAKAIVDELIAAGHIGGRPAIGVTVGPVKYYVEDPDAVPQGLWVESVDENSDAWRKGLRAGDIIVEANGLPTPAIADLNAQKEGLRAGDSLELKIFRDGDYLILSVELVEQYTLAG